VSYSATPRQSAVLNSGTLATQAMPALGLTVAAGSLVAGAVCYDSTVTLNSVSDNGGNSTYNLKSTITDTGNLVKITSFSLGNVGGSPTTITFHFSATCQSCAVVAEWPGDLAAADPNDGTTGAFQTAVAAGANNVSTGSITTTADGDLIVVGLSDTASTTACSAGTSPNAFTSVATASDTTNNFSLRLESFVQAAHAAIAGTGGIVTAGDNAVSNIVAFKPSAGAAVVAGPAHFRGRTFPSQWRPNRSLFQGAAQDQSSFGVETNPHWRGRTWAPQWKPLPALTRNSDPNAPFAQPETNTFFVPKTWPVQWKPWPQGKTTAQDFSSFGVETNPHWQGRVWSAIWTLMPLTRSVPTDVPFVPPDTPTYFQARLWPVAWTPLGVLARLPAVDVLLAQSDAPTYFTPRQLPFIWNLNRALGQNTAQDFSSSSVETNVQFTPRSWPLQWALQASLMRGAAQDFSTLPPVSQPVYARYGASHGIGALSAIPGEIPS
jgi:hypothetical protein